MNAKRPAIRGGYATGASGGGRVGTAAKIARVAVSGVGVVVSVVAVAVGGSSLGCRRSETTMEPPPPVSPEITPPPPRDHLALDELIEGEADAFGIKLPRDMKVDGAFATFVRATGQPSVDAVTKYMKARVSGGTLRSKDGVYFLEGVRSKVAGVKTLEVRIRAGEYGIGSMLEVRDVTPPPPSLHKNDDERFRAAGVDRNGKLLDPKHTQ